MDEKMILWSRGLDLGGRPGDGVGMMEKRRFRSRRERVEASLGVNEFVYDSATMDVDEIADRAAQGLLPVCGCCGARLEFALSPAEARAKRVSPGVRCPRNLNHCHIVVIFARDRE